MTVVDQLQKEWTRYLGTGDTMSMIASSLPQRGTRYYGEVV